MEHSQTPIPYDAFQCSSMALPDNRTIWLLFFGPQRLSMFQPLKHHSLVCNLFGRTHEACLYNKSKYIYIYIHIRSYHSKIEHELQYFFHQKTAEFTLGIHFGLIFFRMAMFSFLSGRYKQDIVFHHATLPLRRL